MGLYWRKEMILIIIIRRQNPAPVAVDCHVRGTIVDLISRLL